MIDRDVPSELQGFAVDESYGPQGRIGLITVGSTLETPLYEFYILVPRGVALVARHMQIRTVDLASADRALSSLTTTAEELRHYSVDCVVVLGGPMAYLEGEPLTRAEEIRSSVESAAGVKTIFEWTASMDALHHLGVESVAVATPFVDHNNQRLAKAMALNRFDVRAISGAGLEGNPDFTVQHLRTCMDTASRALELAGEVDALFIACPRWPVLPLVEEIEARFGLPVVASNQSWVWALKQEMGPSFPVVPIGRLLAA
ncbi:MAG: hypothetical protein GEU79_07610 [Acidimicrobiia bacterium]|nr:hypothetical protein [Acidimicrobiia bacterium]